jgi:nitrogen fixation protein FixH
MTTHTPALGAPLGTPQGAQRPVESFARRYGWPIGIATILLLSAGANILVMFIARADPAFAVEPDYYQKAVGWDATMAQQRANTILGWQADASLVLATPSTPGSVTVTLRTATGDVVEDAVVSVEAMHNARASQRYESTLTPGGDGRYSGAMDAHRPGQWEVRVTAVKGTNRFTQSLRVEAH